MTLTHLALHVSDMDASVAFYRDWCGMEIAHQRVSGRDGRRVIWLAEPGRGQEFVFVLIPGGRRADQAADDYGHLGFALASRQAVEDIAARAEAAGILAWPVTVEDWPVGTYCGVKDPDGRVVEFSYGQPLGPGDVRGPDSS